MREIMTKRPGRPKSEEKAAAIRHAAIGLFMDIGMERTSMDAIATAAGVSKQTIYSHFQSKDDLFRACVAGKIEMYGLSPARLNIDGDIDGLLKHIGRQYLNLLSDPGVIRMFRLMAAEAGTHQETVHSFFETGPLTTTRNIAQILSRYLPQEPGNECQASVATNDYLALVRGDYYLQWLLGIRGALSDDEMDAHLEHCVTQIRTLFAFRDR